MAFVNVGTILNKARTKLTGSLPRPTLLMWFNETARDVLNQPRTWNFLSVPVEIPIVGNQITMPANMAEVVSIQVGDHFFTKADQLSGLEAMRIDEDLSGSDPIGYTLSAANVVTFHPGATGDAILTGELTMVDDYADGATTIFPMEFENLFICGVLEKAFYVDKDGRFTAENTKYQLEMNKMKKWDNLRKPMPRTTSQGYLKQ